MSGARRGSLPVKLSVIIPCWNDAAALHEILAALAGMRGVTEVIVADASPTPECREVAARFSARCVRCAEPNRGAQMNAAAALASGDVLLFHHADSTLAQSHVEALLSAMAQDSRVTGGGFFREFDARHPRLRRLEFFGRLLNRLGGTIYGDQSIFVRREHFEKLGGFAEIPLMEDIEFSGRLRRAGRTVLLDPPLRTSARRHEKRGAWKTTLQNGWLIFLYRLGVSPWRLHEIYYQRKHAAA